MMYIILHIQYKIVLKSDTIHELLNKFLKVPSLPIILINLIGVIKGPMIA